MPVLAHGLEEHIDPLIGPPLPGHILLTPSHPDALGNRIGTCPGHLTHTDTEPVDMPDTSPTTLTIRPVREPVTTIAGATTGVTETDSLHDPQPAPVNARTRTSYSVPFDKPSRMQSVVSAETKHEPPPGRVVT